jgi:PadR family transcriptional regulator AphA
MSGRRRLPMERVLLGFLMEGPMHGYELHARAEAELGRTWTMGVSNIYSALKRLERAGQVESTLNPQENRPPRKVYRITPAGQRGFLDWLQGPVSSIRDMRVEFPAKLYFFHALGLEGIGKLIAAQATVCRERIEHLERRLTQCGPHEFDRLVFDFRRRQIEAILAWLTYCRDELERWPHVPAEVEP